MFSNKMSKLGSHLLSLVICKSLLDLHRLQPTAIVPDAGCKDDDEAGDDDPKGGEDDGGT